MAPVEELALLEFDRSNKGASKQRRDQINAEIATMRDLLPLPESSRQRLSQLQIMSLTCVYIRKCNVLQKLFRSRPQESHLPDSLDFFQAMTGFLLVTTREGKLLYISENVTDYLGHSMVDMKTQGDSLYDIIDKRDHNTVQTQLLHRAQQSDIETSTDVSFFCRMNMSRTLKRQSGFGDVKVMHIRGHFLQMSNSEPACINDSQCVFMATCSPLITPDIKENLVQNNTMVFKSVHKLDMTFLEITKNGEYHLGCTSEDLSMKSWYSMLHPEDIHEAKEKHVQLIRSNHEIGCMFTMRMLRMDGSSFWVNVVMHVRQASLSQNEEPLIVCVNQVIDAHEAYQIKVQGHMFSIYPSRAHEMWGVHLPQVTPSNQDPMSGQWIPQGPIVPAQLPGYPVNIPSYIPHTGCPDMFQGPCSNLATSNRGSKPAVAYPLPGHGSFVQLDQLKAMLKKKIQGPQPTCKPAKIAKMTWDMNGSHEGHGYPETDHSLYQMEHYNPMPISSGVECQNQMMQVLQPENYRVGLMTANKMSLKNISCQSVASKMVSEQIVPDLDVPESFLTPDPSPVSSPQPSYTIVKTEVMDPEERAPHGERITANILQALEKLAALPQSSVKERRPAALRKELPIFDAFDIDNFFEALNPDDLEAKASFKMEMQLKTSVKMELSEDEMQTENIPNFVAIKNERSSPAQLQQGRFIGPNIPQLSTHNQVPPPQYQIGPCVHSPVSQAFIAINPTGLPSHCPDADKTGGNKDMLVSSTMASSPKSTTSQESIDDLLSYFSDDGMDSSPMNFEEQSQALETSNKEDLINAQYQKTYHKPYKCSQTPAMSTPHRAEVLSPPSSTSSLAGEDDLIVDSPTFALDMALSVIDAQSHMIAKNNCDIKDQDVLGLADELKLDFILSSWRPPQGSLDMIKHSQ